MAVNPRFARLDSCPIVDSGGNPREASFSALAVANDRQHALMTGYSAAGRYFSVALETAIDTSKTVTTRIPPGCLWLDLGVLVYGKGTLTITSAADTTGTLFRVTSDTVGAEHADWVWTSGPLPASTGAESARAILVATTASWSWTAVDLTFAFTSITTGVGILGLVVSPILLPV